MPKIRDCYVVFEDGQVSRKVTASEARKIVNQAERGTYPRIIQAETRLEAYQWAQDHPMLYGVGSR